MHAGKACKHTELRDEFFGRRRVGEALLLGPLSERAFLHFTAAATEVLLALAALLRVSPVGNGESERVCAREPGRGRGTETKPKLVSIVPCHSAVRLVALAAAHRYEGHSLAQRHRC